ncbi:MAG TPA: rhomboid family intramembrane serine protease [Phycisphaerae bacterium]|nr:rhomboid family intramembrane serine protease [Phycisphaerae bacterium]
MDAVVEKRCRVCGKDVAGVKRVKDSAGRYYCEPCAKAAAERARGAAAPVVAPVAPVIETREEDAYELAPVAETARAAVRVGLGGGARGDALVAGGPTCPSCEKVLSKGAKICAGCGIKVPSGRPLITAMGRDEDALYRNAEAIIRPLSWLLRLGLYPIASEAYATKKPIAIWAIAILTTICSIAFFVVLRTDGDHDAALSLMLWPAHHVEREVQTDAQILSAYHAIQDKPEGKLLRDIANEKDENGKLEGTEDQRIVATVRALHADSDEQAEPFHPYQLLTNTFLHDPSSIFGLIMHLGGNMLFLLIFGTRVNALVGNLKMLVLYPLLGVAASGAYLIFNAGSSAPALGASGAIMGLAGMYLIFFPVHKVYMAFWLKIFWRIPTWIKIWPMRGFWVLGIYLGFDVAATLLSSQDGVAHWAHIGGFVVGAAVATVMLISRLESANHGDLLSVVLGKWSWPLIGKPIGAAYAGVVRR